MSRGCENCMRWRGHQYRNHMSTEKMQFLLVADEDFRSSMRIPQELGSHFRSKISEIIKLEAPSGCIYDIGVCREMGEIVLRSGWDVFVTAHHIEENDSFLFKYCGNSKFEVQIFSSRTGGQKTSSCVHPPSEIFGAVPRSTSFCRHVPTAQDTSYPGHVQMPIEPDYFTSGGCCLTKAQDQIVREMASTIRSEIPLYVAVMNKSNVDLNGCFINIPLMLLNNSKEDISIPTIKLDGPDCNIYNVVARKHSDYHDEIVLQSGWDTFVVAYHIQENDLLIFIHNGNSRLKVFILDPSCCQKTSSCFVMGDVSSTQEMCDDSVGIIDPHHDMVDIIYVSSSDDSNIVGANIARLGRRQMRQSDHCAKTRKMTRTSCRSIKSEHRTHQPDDLQASVEHGVDRNPLSSNKLEEPSRTLYILSRKIILSGLQEKKVLEKVQAIHSEIPIYVAVMCKSNISGARLGPDLRFAMQYASAYLPDKCQTVTLQLKDKKVEWHTTLFVSDRNIKMILGGWPGFVSDKHLQLGDICLFELAKRTARRLDDGPFHSQVGDRAVAQEFKRYDALLLLLTTTTGIYICLCYEKRLYGLNSRIPCHERAQC